MTDEARYGIEDLATQGGVTRRTVRYYVQQGLIPAPLGKGRGDHYGPEHLERLRAVKALQERGLSLDEVRRELRRPAARQAVKAAAEEAPPALALEAAPWRRIELVPGIELHVSAGRRLPPQARLRELLEWCERSFE